MSPEFNLCHFADPSCNPCTFSPMSPMGIEPVTPQLETGCYTTRPFAVDLRTFSVTYGRCYEACVVPRWYLHFFRILRESTEHVYSRL